MLWVFVAANLHYSRPVKHLSTLADPRVKISSEKNEEREMVSFDSDQHTALTQRYPQIAWWGFER